MIDYFDTYVCTKGGFIATKGDLMFECYRIGSGENSFRVSMYKSKQTHKRAMAHAAEGTRAWCRMHAARMAQGELYQRWKADERKVA